MITHAVTSQCLEIGIPHMTTRTVTAQRLEISIIQAAAATNKATFAARALKNQRTLGSSPMPRSKSPQYYYTRRHWPILRKKHPAYDNKQTRSPWVPREGYPPWGIPHGIPSMGYLPWVRPPGYPPWTPPTGDPRMGYLPWVRPAFSSFNWKIALHKSAFTQCFLPLF